jgi:hypothetical protein
MPAFSPTHKEEEIWHIVAFLRHLPEITKEEQQVLKARGSEEEHHHGEGAEAAGKPEGKGEVTPPAGGKPGHAHPPGTAPHKD